MTLNAPNAEGLDVTVSLSRVTPEGRTAVASQVIKSGDQFQLTLPQQQGLYAVHATVLAEANGAIRIIRELGGGFAILVDNAVLQSEQKKAAWEALRLDGVGSVPFDGFQRNRQITKFYAEAYTNNKLADGTPYLRYLGMAAFASKLVGDSIAAAGIGQALGPTEADRQAARQGYALLGWGNLQIYMSMYPAALAYLSDLANHPNGNIQAVQALIPNPNDQLRLAWEDLHNARLNNNQAGIWAAGVAMVDYEQTVVLQSAIADTPEQQQFWTGFSQNHGHRIRPPYPGAKSFKQVLPNGNYGNADHRMQWFLHEPDGLYPKAKEWLEAHPDGISVQVLLDGGYGI